MRFDEDLRLISGLLRVGSDFVYNFVMGLLRVCPAIVRAIWAA